MEGADVRRLEAEIGRAIETVLAETGVPGGREPVDPRVAHLMAKAAVSVLEAVRLDRPGSDRGVQR